MKKHMKHLVQKANESRSELDQNPSSEKMKAYLFWCDAILAYLQCEMAEENAYTLTEKGRVAAGQ